MSNMDSVRYASTSQCNALTLWNVCVALLRRMLTIHLGDVVPPSLFHEHLEYPLTRVGPMWTILDVVGEPSVGLFMTPTPGRYHFYLRSHPASCNMRLTRRFDSSLAIDCR